MKKIIIIILSVFLISGCSVCAEEETAVRPTFSELTPKFIYEIGKCLRDNVLIEYMSLNRGREINIVNQDDDYYYIDNNGLLLSVDKNFIRTENEEPFVSYTGYTRSGSCLYSDINLSDKIDSFKLNDEIKVLDRFVGVLLVEYNNSTGYMSVSSVSDTKIKEYVAPKPSSNPSSSSDSGYTPSYTPSDSGNNSSSEPSSPAPSSGDGEDILLSYTQPVYINTFLSNSIMEGIILADNTPTYIAVLNRGDIVKVLEYKDDYSKILISGRPAYIKSSYIRLDSQVDYVSWDGYAKSGTVAYSDFDFNNRIKSFSVNDILHIIDEVEDRLVIELDDGQIAYIRVNNASESKISVYIPPAPVVSPSDNGDSGGSYTPPAPQDEPTPKWTDPVL